MRLEKKRVVILGATGSIGENAVKVALELKDRIEVVGLVARNSLERLAEQAAELECPEIITTDDSRFNDLKQLAPSGCRVSSGEDAVIELVSRDEVDLVLCAIVGTGGLLPVIAALRAGKDIALASKEVLVMAGELVSAAAKESGARIIPVDSEHSAIFQCLEGRKREEVSKLILTASGGPFRDASREEIENATYEKALAHPTWDMGPKVTIDSATMMNKALEIVEAGYMFDMPPEKIDVVIHRESVVHSMVEFIDYSIIAQLSNPDMRFPIQYAMTWPERVAGNLPRLDFSQYAKLSFQVPGITKFPSLGFAYESLRRKGTMPAVMNAANEVAVDKFSRGEIAFTSIWSIIERVMAAHEVVPQSDLKTVLAADKWARKAAADLT
jgi:1-deoxy-D-xylulose-5-phosphate reductoisomerase